MGTVVKPQVFLGDAGASARPQERQFPAVVQLALARIAAGSVPRFPRDGAAQRAQAVRELVAGTADLAPGWPWTLPVPWIGDAPPDLGPGDRPTATHRLGGHESTPAEGIESGQSLRTSGVGDDDLLAAPVQNSRYGGGPGLAVFRLHGDASADEIGGQRGGVAVVDGAPLAGFQAMRTPTGERIGGGRGGGRVPLFILLVRGQIEQRAVLGALQSLVEGLLEPEPGAGVPVGLVLDDRADEDQLAGALLAFAGGDAVLGAPDLIFEGALFLALEGDKLFFTLAEALLQIPFALFEVFELVFQVHR